MITAKTFENPSATLELVFPPEAIAGFQFFFGLPPGDWSAECDAGRRKNSEVEHVVRMALIGAGMDASRAGHYALIHMTRGDPLHGDDERRSLASELVREAMAA
jgi:hypothetical protein